MIRWQRGAAVGLAAVTLAACGGVEAPRQEMGSAKQAVSQARKTEAPQYAPDAFGKANVKLAQAQAALAKGEHARARRLAEEASVDAELAQATAENARNKAALDKMRRSIKTLQSKVHEAPAQATKITPGSAEPPAGSSNATR